MANQIKIGNSVLTVTSLYPYQYNCGEGREVLRIEIARADHSYPEIEALLEAPAGDITYLEEGQVVTVYKGYQQDFRCSYANGSYQVEIARVSPLERKVAALEEQLAALSAGR